MNDPDNSGSDRATADILVLGGIAVTMDERRTILPDGALALRGDSIVALGPVCADRHGIPCCEYRRRHRVLGDPRSHRRPDPYPDDPLPQPSRRLAAAHYIFACLNQFEIDF
jgi:hypothetical protein